jgi:hypothetical protein
MTASAEVRELLEMARAQSPGALVLARLVAPAPRIEPELLRAIRIAAAPEVDAGAEADLWFGPLVGTRGAGVVSLDADVADALRDELAAAWAKGGHDRAPLLRARGAMQRIHATASPALALEERLAWLAIEGGGSSELEAELWPALRALADPARMDVATWALQAWPRLPAAAQRSRAGLLLRAAATARLSLPLDADRPPAGIDIAAALRALPHVPLGISWTSDVLRLGATDDDAVEILIPDLQPRWIELTWLPEGANRSATDADRGPVVVTWSGDAVVEVTAGEASAARLVTASGDVYELPRAMERPRRSAPTDELLQRFMPILRYDSNEQFFADSAEQCVVNPGNRLQRGSESGDGLVLASAEPSRDEPVLTLKFLARGRYADGTAVESDDCIAFSGKDYREQYRRLRMEHPELSNCIYGHAVEANGRLWLQYWMWFFYNDYQLAFGAGTHEGDWEMVQFRMDEAAGHPDIGVYKQHRYGEMRRWEDIEKLDEPDRPVVYVARGSHAAYFEAGFHQTEGWYDIADGKRRSARRMQLEILDDREPSWPHWPGRWGGTLARRTLDSASPTGPAAHKWWKEPDRLLEAAPSLSKHRGTGGRAPDVRIASAGGRLRVEYDVADRDPAASSLVLTVSSQDESGIPPRTVNVDVAETGRGALTTDVVLDPLKRYDVYTSVIAGDPPQPSESVLTLISPNPDPVRSLTVMQRVLTGVSSRIAWLRGDRRRGSSK